MKLISHSPLFAPALAPTPTTLATTGAGRTGHRTVASPDAGLSGAADQDAGASRGLRAFGQASAGERQALARGFELTRALTRGRIQGLQTALRTLTQLPADATGSASLPALPELRCARVALCDRLQAQYALFLAASAAAPEGLPRASRGSWRRSQMRQLLQEDLEWVRRLPGDHEDLLRALHAGLDRIAPHSPL